MIQLIRRVDDNWYEGRVGNQQGIFPVTYVVVDYEPDTPLQTPMSSYAPTPVPGKYTRRRVPAHVRALPATAYHFLYDLGSRYIHVSVRLAVVDLITSCSVFSFSELCLYQLL